MAKQITVAREIRCPTIEISSLRVFQAWIRIRGRIMPVHRLAGRLSNQA